MVTEIWPIQKYLVDLTFDLISQVTSSISVTNHKSVSLVVTDIWPVENFEGRFYLDFNFSRSSQMHSDIISHGYKSHVYISNGCFHGAN